jgi:polysaccharide biosynthesis protein VpsJ
MATTPVSVGRDARAAMASDSTRGLVSDSLFKLYRWLEAEDYRGYDTFDGLNARFVRPLTFENPLLRIVLQQGVRRFPLNLRPLLGVRKAHSTKAMGFFARGFIRLHQALGDDLWRSKAEETLNWLVNHQSPGYSGACWGNHFDYQSRSVFVHRDSPSVVWTSLIGHAFLDAYEHFGQQRFLDTAISCCTHIQKDLGAFDEQDSACIHYFPTSTHQVHNANTLGGSLLARTWFHAQDSSYLALAERSMRYTAKYQRADGSWYYGEASNLRWVDNFHTAYVLDSFKHYRERTGDTQFDRQMAHGYQYWKATFFLPDGTPRYYSHKTMPLDIQCASQAIDTLIFFSDQDPEALPLAARVARWTIEHMQDRSGYFYYRRYAPWIVNRTPTLHWGQATMFCALAGLHSAMSPPMGSGS